MATGYIYVMTNPALKGMVKIGYATDVEARRKQLSTTALPYDYEVYATYGTSGKIEDKKLHQLIDQLNDNLRVTKSREFYLMTPEEAYTLLESIALISNTGDKLKKTTPADFPAQKQTVKRPPIDFFKCGIPKGAELVCTEDPSIRPVVESERKVIYKDQITSLTSIMRDLKGQKYIAGPAYFTYNGKPLCDIANETQWKDY